MSSAGASLFLCYGLIEGDRGMTILVISLLPASVAQIIPTAANPSEVHVLKYGWRRLNARVSTGRTKAERTEEGIDDPIDPGATFRKGNQDQSGPAEREKYEYRIRFKNGSSKTVRRIVWAYVFADPASDKELARRRFKSDLKIAPNTEKEQTEIGNWRTGPPALVNAAPANKNEKLWKESVIVEEVKYSDGSTWNLSRKWVPKV